MKEHITKIDLSNGTYLYLKLNINIVTYATRLLPNILHFKSMQEFMTRKNLTNVIMKVAIKLSHR
jgi:hypothetical protein